MSRYCGNLCHGLEIRPYPHAVLIKVGASWRQLSPGSGEGQSSKNGPERERMSNQRHPAVSAKGAPRLMPQVRPTRVSTGQRMKAIQDMRDPADRRIGGRIRPVLRRAARARHTETHG